MRSTATLVLLAGTAALLVACVDSAPGATDDDGTGTGTGDGDGDEPINGGSLLLEDCGYAVTTPDEASAPRPARAITGPDGTPRHVHLGFGGSPATSMAVLWRTMDDETEVSTIQFGQGADLTVDELGETREGFTFFYTSGFGRAGDPVRVHEVHLCGLEPDTEYSYRVGGGTAPNGDEAWSPIYTFRTAPTPGDSTASVKVLNLGDSRDGYDVWHDLLVEAEKRGVPDLILFSGDAVTIGNIQVEWEQFFDEGEFLLARVPMVSAHGNHELNAVNFGAQLAHPVNDRGDERMFAFDYGPLRIVSANDSPVIADELGGTQKDFIDAAFTAGADQPWKILLHHRSLYSASENHGGDQELLQLWGPVIDEHEVDFVLAGHDHNYERSWPMRGGAVAADPSEGTTYVVSGGAGAPLYENGSDVWTAVSEKAHGMVLMTFSGDVSVDYEAVTNVGAVIDSFTVTKP